EFVQRWEATSTLPQVSGRPVQPTLPLAPTPAGGAIEKALPESISQTGDCTPCGAFQNAYSLVMRLFCPLGASKVSRNSGPAAAAGARSATCMPTSLPDAAKVAVIAAVAPAAVIARSPVTSSSGVVPPVPESTRFPRPAARV